jgi:hypothetical protein
MRREVGMNRETVTWREEEGVRRGVPSAAALSPLSLSARVAGGAGRGQE